jgi:3-dehydroquinate synthase
MGLDKKVVGGKIRFVLLHALGKAIITDEVPEDLLRLTLETCCE